MRWLDLIADTRIKFLLVFIFIAVFVAIVLTYFEFRAKKNKIKKEIVKKESTFIVDVRKQMAENSSPQKRLDFLDRIVKKYIFENYNLTGDYAVLVSAFKKAGNTRMANFCTEMFYLYYSVEVISDAQLVKMSEVFLKIFNDMEEGKFEEEKNVENVKNSEKTLTPVLLQPNQSSKNESPATTKIDWKQNFENMEQNKAATTKEKILQKALILKQKEIAKRKIEEEQNKAYSVDLSGIFKKSGPENLYYGS